MRAVAPRSLFVTNFAWLVICIAALSTVAALLQTLLWIVAPAVFESLEHPAAGRGGLPVSFMLFFQVFSAVQLVLSAAALALGRGLLARRRWARRACVVALWLVLFASIPFVLLMFLPPVAAIATVGEPGAPPLVFGLAMAAVVLAGAIGFFVIVGWILKRLGSAEVRREFGAA